MSRFTHWFLYALLAIASWIIPALVIVALLFLMARTGVLDLLRSLAAQRKG